MQQASRLGRLVVQHIERHWSAPTLHASCGFRHPGGGYLTLIIDTLRATLHRSNPRLAFLPPFLLSARRFFVWLLASMQKENGHDARRAMVKPSVIMTGFRVGLDITLDQGEVLALIGPNGGGKKRRRAQRHCLACFVPKEGEVRT